MQQLVRVEKYENLLEDRCNYLMVTEDRFKNRFL